MKKPTEEKLLADAQAIQWALSYPFARPDTDFVFHNGSSYPMQTHGVSIGDWSVITAAASESKLGNIFDDVQPGNYQLVLAVGSNGSPVQLWRKFRNSGHDATIPVVRLTLVDHIVAYAARIAPYGSIPSTIAPWPGARAHVWGTLLTPELLAEMNESEGVGVDYSLETVPIDNLPAALEASGKKGLAYSSISGFLSLQVDLFADPSIDIPMSNQWGAQQRVIEMLGEKITVDEFVRQNIAKPELLKQRDRALSELGQLIHRKS